MSEITWHEEDWQIDKLRGYDRNPRKITPSQRATLKAAIVKLGYHHPCAVQPDGLIISGHQRWDVLKELGRSTVRVSIPSRQLTNGEFEQMLIQGNLTNGEFDWDVVGRDFKKIDLLEWGMPIKQVSKIPRVWPDIGKTDPDAAPDAPQEPQTKLGDVWICGAHRVMCGDSVGLHDVEKLLNGVKVEMVYTDPPYGVSIVNTEGKVGAQQFMGKVGGNKAFGKVGTIDRGMKEKPIIEANLYAPIIGDDTTETAIAAFNLCAGMKPKVMIFWGGNYYASALPDSSCWIVWDKDNGESFFADAELAWTNQKTAVRIFKHTWNGLIKASERGERRVHPTQKPVALAEWCLENYGEGLTAILDLFGGSGSTLIACEKTARRCFVMELAPAYCDVIVTRWQNFTGKVATLEATGGAFQSNVAVV